MQTLQSQILEALGQPQAAQPAAQAQAAKPAAPPVTVPGVNWDSPEDFENLKKALFSDKWPEAVNPHLICDPNSEQDKMERARGIIELMIEEDMKGLKMLDMGCGEGHCVALASEYHTGLAVGYDLKQYPSWESFRSRPNTVYTTDFAEVKQHGPFDVVIIFDVIDHSMTEMPSDILKKASGVLKDSGKIYMRTHPFVSRHATHLYHDLNKAYIHLIFSNDELKQLIPEARFEEPSLRIVTPIIAYETFIKDANLVQVNKREITEKVEPFFKIPKIAERIMGTVGFKHFPDYQMSIQFIDYVLTKKQ